MAIKCQHGESNAHLYRVSEKSLTLYSFVDYMNQYGHWDLLVDDFNSSDHYGFIYFIYDKIHNKRYIGKRNFVVRGKPKDSWMLYTGSQRHLNIEISIYGKENFDFLIVNICESKDELCNRETELLIKNNVLNANHSNGQRIFYNRTITPNKMDSSGIRRRDWLKVPPDYPVHKFKNVYTDDTFSGTHIDLAYKLSIDSKRILGLLTGKRMSVYGWVLDSVDITTIRQRFRRIENIVTGEIFIGSTKDIISHIGTTRSCLKDLLYGKQKTTRGWRLIK